MAAVASLLVAAIPMAGLVTDAGGERKAAERGPGLPSKPERPGDARAAGAGRSAEPSLVWRDSRSPGTPNAGRLVDGVKLPREGRTFFTWNPVTDSVPNAPLRRYGSDRLVRVLLGVLNEYARDHPAAPRVGVGDLSLKGGGGAWHRHGGGAHLSHQNGLDVDVYYPRRDRREQDPVTADRVDLRLAQSLVDRFVDAGAELVFVGPTTPLTGPPEVVQPLDNHDNHLHVRFPADPFEATREEVLDEAPDLHRVPQAEVARLEPGGETLG